MRRAIGVLAVALAALAALTAVSLAACTGSAGPATVSAPTVAQARSVLSRYAAAVLSRDRAKLRALIDPAADTFRAAQARELANVAQVPLAAWRYQVVGTIRDRAAQRAVTARLHAPALLLHVRFGYELRGIDTRPSLHDQYFSFVERGGRTYLAGQDPLAAEGTLGWAPPWQYGPLAVARGRASLVLGPRSADLAGLADEIDAAIPAVTAVWGPDWSQRVAALVPVSAAEFQALTGGTGTSDDSAVAVTDGIDSGTGQPYGQRLILNPTQLGRLSGLGRRIVLRHEITHLASAADTADITPRWLVEGSAEYVANLGTGQPVREAAAELRAAVRARRLPTALPGDDAFAATGSALARVYEQSWLACRLIAVRVGQRGLVRFYRAVGTALEPNAEAVADAFRAVLHESQQAFVRQWQTYLKTELS